jgi:hypothetical protein
VAIVERHMTNHSRLLVQRRVESSAVLRVPSIYSSDVRPGRMTNTVLLVKDGPYQTLDLSS